MRALSALLASCCLLVLAGCGDTLQDQPVPHNTLEGLMMAPFPVYWLGGSFHRYAVTDAEKEASGSYWVQYGDCIEGGQGECVPPLRVVTSPDNSFLPGTSRRRPTAEVRGVRATLERSGRTIIIATGRVVVDVYARDASLAHAAAQTLVPINADGAPGDPLPAAIPDTGYGSMPLSTQIPSSVRVIG